MFKRKKKKTGVQTPEFRKPTPPPPLLTLSTVTQSKEECGVSRTIKKALVGTKERFHLITSNLDYANMLKIENADVYWNDQNGAIIVVTTSEWRDYLTGTRDTPFVERGCSNCIDDDKCELRCFECNDLNNYKCFKVKENDKCKD